MRRAKLAFVLLPGDQKTVYVSRQRTELVCSCGKSIPYSPDASAPQGYGCFHIDAVYNYGLAQSTPVRFTALGYQLFAHIWAAHLLLKD